MIKEIVFNGPDGRLEGKYYKSSEKNAPIALVLHPHPLHGGNMNNKVVYNAFYAMVELKFSVLRFNFRGVGKSNGVFDHGVGELLDAASALDWLQLQSPDASSCWLLGFSFGAWISLQLLMRRPEISGFIAISPPAKSYDFNFLVPCPSQGLIIQGTKDTLAPEEQVYSMYEKLAKQRQSSIDYHPITDADHFYTGKLDDLKSAIINYVHPRISLEPIPKKLKRDRRRRSNSVDDAA
jgi:alpha/beta superfamily hydrolase